MVTVPFVASSRTQSPVWIWLMSIRSTMGRSDTMAPMTTMDSASRLTIPSGPTPFFTRS